MTEPLSQTIEAHANQWRPGTANVYRSVVRRLKAWCDRAKPLTLDRTTFKRYRDERAATVSNTTVNSELAALGSLYEWAVQDERMPYNPVRGVRRLQQAETDTHRVYTPAQLETLSQALKRADTDLWLFCQLVLFALVRPGELCGLQISDFHFERSEVTVPASVAKNKRTKTVAIPVGLSARLAQRWQGRQPAERAFSHLPHSYAKRFRAVVNGLGWGGQYTLYGLKHTGAVRLYEQTGNVEECREQMRHADLSATAVYLRGRAVKRSRAVLAAKVWD